MNKCILKGRMASDPEHRNTQSGIAQCTFRVAVNRRRKNADGERQTDFHQCVAWRHNANFVHNFFNKGDMVSLCGELQNRSYVAQDGTTRYVTEIVVDEIEGWGSGQGKQSAPENQEPSEGQGYAEVDDSELPF